MSANGCCRHRQNKHERDAAIIQKENVAGKKGAPFHFISAWDVLSDGWAAYFNIDQVRGGIYTHDDVNHRQNFVDPNDPSVYTQGIEGMQAMGVVYA